MSHNSKYLVHSFKRNKTVSKDIQSLFKKEDDETNFNLREGINTFTVFSSV